MIKFLLTFLFWSLQSVTFSVQFDKAAYYSALSSTNINAVNHQLEDLKQSDFSSKPAFEGTLLMKKSGIINGPAKLKLELFKSGRLKLEQAIAKEPDNIEFRFLRLIIQEHAPKIVKYTSDLKADAQLIQRNFKQLPSDLQQHIRDYQKKSTVLKLP